MDIYSLLLTKPHNIHYLNRYFKFIQKCQHLNKSIFKKSKETPNGIYMESHHILPQGEFPEYISFKAHPWNKIDLTLRQHFIAHMMLYKCYGNTQIHAFYSMTCWNNIKINSKLYENNRNEYIKRQSLLNIGREPANKGKPSKAKGTKFYNNGITQIQVLPGSEPNGFVLGRLNKPWNYGLTSETNDKVKEIGEKCSHTKKLQNNIPWNYGLTKNDHPSLKQAADKLKVINLGKSHSKETRKRMSESHKRRFTSSSSSLKD